MNLAPLSRHQGRHAPGMRVPGAQAEQAMANEFKFEDYPDAMKFTPVTEQAIGALASQFGLEFSADYMAFLKAHNGFCFDGLKGVRPLAIEAYDTIDSLRYLFGIDTGFEYNDLRVFLSNMYFWDRAFCAFAYPIGEGPGGDPIVQIFKGKAKGRIYFVDHEVIPNADDMKDDGVDIETMSADSALAYLRDERGCFNEIAASFSDFLGKLVAYDNEGRISVDIRL
jgi:hypothetical protein